MLYMGACCPGTRRRFSAAWASASLRLTRRNKEFEAAAAANCMAKGWSKYDAHRGRMAVVEIEL